jgi:O-antigen ligase
VKISVQPRTSPAVAGSDRRWVIITATAILAAAIGVSIAGTNWILLVALLASPILLLRPRDLSLGAYAFLLPFDSITKIGPAGQTLTLIAGAAAAAILLGTALVKKDLQRPPRQALWWGLFVTWAAVTVLWALEWQPAVSRLFTTFSLLFVYLAVLSANISRKELQTISLFAVAGGFAAAVYTAFQFFGGAFYGGGIRGSLMAGNEAADPNYLAASLLLPLSLAVYGFLTPRRWLARLGWLLVAGTIAFGIFVTMSRGALVAMAVMILFYVLTKRVSRSMTIALVIVLVALTFVLPSSFYSRLQTAVDSGGTGRTIIWRGGLVAFQHYALFGAGLNNFPYAYRDYIGSAPLFRGIQSATAAHNSYLEIAVDMGLVGLALMLAAIVGQLRAASRCRKNVPDKIGGVIVAYEAACYAILVAAFFIGVIWEKWFWLAWILLAIAVRTSKAKTRIGADATGSELAAWPWDNLVSRSASEVTSARPA